MNLSKFLHSTILCVKETPAAYQIRRLSTLNEPPKILGDTKRGTRILAKNDAPSFKIIDNANEQVKTHQPAGSQIELADLECRLGDNRRLLFNLTWLRDSCHCDKCTHKFSRQRLFTPKDFRINLFGIENIDIVAAQDSASGYIQATRSRQNKCLNIKWTDGHDSFYSLDWLNELHDLFIRPQLKREAPQEANKSTFSSYPLPPDDFYAPRLASCTSSECWSVEQIQSRLEPIDYHDLLDGFRFHADEPTFINANRISDMSARRYEAILSLTNQLARWGLAKIVNVPLERDQVLNVARSLAYERPTGYGTIFDVVIEPSEEINLAYSSQEFDLHSDLTYREKSPGVQMLHCIRNSVDGGLSYFSDAFQAAEIMRRENPTLFNTLVQFPVVFVVRDPYRDVKFRLQKPILNLDYRGNLDEVYYSPFMLPPVGHIDDLKMFYLAQERFTQLLQAKENKFITKMDPGQLFIFNNRRVLHGRSSYDPKTSDRFLQGCYMDWDELLCLREKFQSNKRDLSASGR